MAVRTGILLCLLPLLSPAAVTVKTSSTLRSGGCDVDAPAIAELPAGIEVTVRSSINGSGGVCYRVSATVAGRTETGNLPGTALAGLEEFDRSRQSAAAGGDAVQVITSAQVESLRKSLATAGDTASASLPPGPLRQASELLDRNQPGQALEVLSPHLKEKNPSVLILAGVAAWKSDQTAAALEHWKSAQSIRPMPELQTMITRLEREIRHDRSGEKLVGLRVALRYDNGAIPYPTAKGMLETLDSEVARLSQMLGCAAQERLVAIVQTPDDYRQGAAAAEWSGGQFDGRIRIPFAAGAALDENARRVFAHEATHACLATLGPWPAWLHEGLAQKLSGERLTPVAKAQILELASKRQIPKLQEFRRNWSDLNAREARIAYAAALLAGEELVNHYGASIGLRTILGNRDILERVTNEINRKMGLAD